MSRFKLALWWFETSKTFYQISFDLLTFHMKHISGLARRNKIKTCHKNCIILKYARIFRIFTKYLEILNISI